MGNKLNKERLPYDFYIEDFEIPKYRGEIEFSDYSLDKDEIEEKADYFAKKSFDKTEIDELDVIKNDRLLFIREYDKNFYMVKNLRTKQIGVVPKFIIAPYEDFFKADWYFSYTRQDAERKLQGQEPGEFLVRNSTSENSWALSLSCSDSKVRHYKICKLDSGKYFLDTDKNNGKKTFDNVEQLLNHLKKYEILYHKLTKPVNKTFYNSDMWEIKRDDIIQIDQELGRGHFGIVKQGILKYKNIPVAIKTFPSEDISRAEIYDEISKLKKLKHEKIVQFYGACIDGDPILMIFECMKNGSLKIYLKNCKLEFISLIDISAQVSSGMKYLEDNKVIHGDLAARNVLVGENNIVKISDFGLSQKLNESNKNYLEANNKTNIPIISAPEVLMKLKYTIKSDVWSFGLLLYEIFTFGEDPPFKEITKFIAKMNQNSPYMPVHNQTNQPLIPINNEKIPDNIYLIITNCLKFSPNERYSFEELQDTFVKILENQ